MRTIFAIFLILIYSCEIGVAIEFIDGRFGPPTQRNGMHSCPPGFAVTGVHVDNNWLLCEGPYTFRLVRQFPGQAGISDEVPDFGITPANQFPYTNGRTMHWCGQNRMVTGVHVAQNGFGCAAYVERDGTTESFGTPFIDGGPVSAPTQRHGMHACPLGTVLVGAFFDENAFLCAERNYCTTDDEVQCPSGKQCKPDVPPSPGGDLLSLTGICRPVPPPTLTVRNVVVPSNDPGRFNLQIDGVTKVVNVGNEGSTGPQVVDVGVHTVGEMASAGTRSTDYDQVISGACDANGTVTLALGESKTCTISNTRRVPPTVCLQRCQVKLDACPDDPRSKKRCAQDFTRCVTMCSKRSDLSSRSTTHAVLGAIYRQAR